MNKFKIGDKVMFNPEADLNKFDPIREFFNKVFTIKSIRNNTDIRLEEEMEYEFWYHTRFMLAEKYLHNKDFNIKMKELLK